ncbi:MAG: ArsR/SmtB family transcription factor [Solirubrobacteraceae bacterium]
MVERQQRLDRVYRALADSTRRSLLTALRSSDARIKDLAEPLPMSFAAVAQHVATLERAQLVSRQIRGREHWISITPDGLREAEAWIAQQSAARSSRADALSDYLQRSTP